MFRLYLNGVDVQSAVVHPVIPVAQEAEVRGPRVHVLKSQWSL